MINDVMMKLPEFSAAIAEIFVLFMACVTLLTYLFFSRTYKNITYYFVQFTLVGALILSASQIGSYSALSFSGLYIGDDIGNWLKVFIYITSFGSFFYAEQYVVSRGMPRGEYYLLGLFSILGMMVLVSAHSLLTIYLGLETLSLPLYAMIALRRSHSDSIEASIKYFIMGAVASGMLLYGMSMLYGATGSLDLSEIAKSLNISASQHSMLLSFSLVFIVVGIGFKLSAVPFHMWAPDVYEGAPSSVTLFLSTAPKLAAVGMAFRIFAFGLPELAGQWQQLLIIMAILSTGVGNIVAIIQTNFKRMLAYSGIGHVGFILLGLLAHTPEGYSAALFYILTYSLMALAAFGIIVLMSKSGFEAENIEDFKGLNSKSPWLAFLLLTVMFSMAGVPPTVGFLAKLFVLKEVIAVDLTWLAVICLVFSVIGSYYYIRIVKVMYFEDTPNNTPIVIGRGLMVFFSINALSFLVLGLFPAGLMSACIAAFAN